MSGKYLDFLGDEQGESIAYPTYLFTLTGYKQQVWKSTPHDACIGRLCAQMRHLEMPCMVPTGWCLGIHRVASCIAKLEFGGFGKAQQSSPFHHA